MATTTSAPPRFQQRTTGTPAPAGSTRHEAPWLSVPLSFSEDARVDDIAETLTVDPDHVSMSILRLWVWATRTRRTAGYVGDLSATSLARHSGWHASPAPDWRNVLMLTGFIGDDGVLADWSALGGRRRRGEQVEPVEKITRRRAALASYARAYRLRRKSAAGGDGADDTPRHHIRNDDGIDANDPGDVLRQHDLLADMDDRGPVNGVHATTPAGARGTRQGDEIARTSGPNGAVASSHKTMMTVMTDDDAGTLLQIERHHLEETRDIYSVLRTEGETARPGGGDFKTKNTTEITATAAPARGKRAPATGPAATTDATKAYREVLKISPNEAQRTAINTAVAQDPDALVRWREVLIAWTLRGNKPTNVQGCLDWFAGGVPEAGPARQSSGRGGWVDAPVLTTREYGALAGEAGVRVRTMLQRAASYSNGGRMPAADAAFILSAIGRTAQAGATVTEAGPSVVIDVPVLAGDTTPDTGSIVAVAQVPGGPVAQATSAPGGSWASGRLVTRNGITLVDNGSRLDDFISEMQSRRNLANRAVFKPADTIREVWVQDARGEWVPRGRCDTDPPMPGHTPQAPTVAVEPALPVPVVNREIGALAPRPSPKQVRADAARRMREAVASGRWASQTQAVN